MSIATALEVGGTYPHVGIQTADLVELVCGQIKRDRQQIFRQSIHVVTFWNDGDPALRSPTEQDLCWTCTYVC
jgi:hypothetical protein